LEEDFKKEETERSIFYQSYLSASNTMNSSTLSYKSSTSPLLNNQTQAHYSTLQNHHLHHNNNMNNQYHHTHHQQQHHQNGSSNSVSPTADTPIMPNAMHVGGGMNGQNGQHLHNFLWTNDHAGDGTSSSSNSSTGGTPYGTSNGLINSANFIYSPQKLIANNRKANDY
jgi:hypothetical protein